MTQSRARSKRSQQPPPTRSSSRRGSPTFPRPRACLRRAHSSDASRALRASWSTPPKAYAYARALAAARRASHVFTIGKSEEGREILMLAMADEQGIRDLDRSSATPPPSPIRASTDAAAAERLIARGPPDLLLQRSAARGRDRLDEGDAGAGLPARGVRAADDPAHPRTDLVVLINPVSNPDGRDKMVEWFYRFLKGKTDYAAAAAPVAAVLVEVRVRGHQPRRAPADARGHAGRPPHVPRVAPDGGARPARERRAADDLERHRTVQPEHRSDHARRVPGDEPARGAGA